MGECERASKLFGDIYDAALDPTLWPTVLEECSRFVGGAASALFMKDSVQKTHNTVHTFGYDANFTRIYIDEFVHLDPFTTGQFFFEVGEVVAGADLVPHAEFRQSRFYKEWVKPQGWIDAMGVMLEKSATRYSAFSVIRSEKNGVVDDETRRRMALIAPHVRRAVLIGKVIDLRKIEAAALADTLDGLAAALFLVDSDNRIVHANAAGHAMLAEASIMRSAGSKLAALDDEANKMLCSIINESGGGDTVVGMKGVAVPLSSGVEDYVAHVLPLTSGARRAGVAYSAVAAIFVCKAELELPHPVEALAHRYKLTPAEMRVLLPTIEIGGIREVARALGVSETTVKTHLRRIFRKTGAARQADLVKLVASFASPIGP